MAFEAGSEVGLYLSKEGAGKYGIPVKPTAANNIDVVTANFTVNDNQVESQTNYAGNPFVTQIEPGHVNSTWEAAIEVPIAAASSVAARTGFWTMLEMMMGKAVVTPSTGVLPTYGGTDALKDLSGDAAAKFEMGSRPADSSYTLWKTTETGHECGYGAVLTRGTISMGLDQYLTFNMSGGIKDWSKFEPGNLKAIPTVNQKTFSANEDKGSLGVGSFVKFVAGSGFSPSTGGYLIDSYNPKTGAGTVTEDITPITSITATSGINDAFWATPTRTNQSVESIWGDNISVSIDGGDTLLQQVSSVSIEVNNGVNLNNNSAASRTPVGTWQGRARVAVTIGFDVDADEMDIFRRAARDTNLDLHIAVGGLDASAGGLMLFHFPKVHLPRQAPNTPNEGLSSVTFNAGALGQQAAGGAITAPMTAYIR